MTQHVWEGWSEGWREGGRERGRERGGEGQGEMSRRAAKGSFHRHLCSSLSLLEVLDQKDRRHKVTTVRRWGVAGEVGRQQEERTEEGCGVWTGFGTRVHRHGVLETRPPLRSLEFNVAPPHNKVCQTVRGYCSEARTVEGCVPYLEV